MSNGNKDLLKMVALVIGVVVVVVLFKQYETEGIKEEAEQRVIHTIEYRVDGACESASLTYRNIQGGTEQVREARLPWSYKQPISTTQLNKIFLSISAQNDCRSGSITSSIYVDGNQIKTSKSSGAYVIASASTSYPPR